MAKNLRKVPVSAGEKTKAGRGNTVEVPIHYEKSNLFRVIHADGVVGNILPSGRAMNLAFYSERIPFPKTDVYDIGPDGKMIRPREGAGERKPGFFREIEISAVMDWYTAKSLSDWLNQVWPLLKDISERKSHEHVAATPASGGAIRENSGPSGVKSAKGSEGGAQANAKDNSRRK